MRLLAFAIRVLYRLFCLLPQQEKVVFMSRQSARPFDFELLEPALLRRMPGTKVEWTCGCETGGGPGVALTARQLWHAATARLVVVDGYIPAVAIPRRRRAKCLLLWHALGAVKKFGYQSVGTPDGRSAAQAEAGRMHRGYDAIVVGLACSVPAFAQAFDVDPGRIQAAGLPRMDYLTDGAFSGRRGADAHRVRRSAGIPDGAKAVLYAPTLRRRGDAGWLHGQACALADGLPQGWVLLVSGHPLQASGAAKEHGAVRYLESTPSVKALGLVEAVVTDYSAVAFEAALAGKPVLFYVPDIVEYRESPGVNIDPEQEFPRLAFRQAGQLGGLLVDDAVLSQRPLDRFVQQAQAGAIGRILDVAELLLRPE